MKELLHRCYQELEKLRKIEELMQWYSTEGLFLMGKDYIKDGNYFEANLVFEKLSKMKGDLRGISELYSGILSALMTPTDKITSFKDMIASDLIYWMDNSIWAYSEGNLSKEDLFGIEKIIDQFPYKKLKLDGNRKFEKSYCEFKEHILKVFLGEK
jgi:hypothetical protein